MKSHGVFWSIVWKDYRELRAFWLATVLLAVGLEAFVGFLATGQEIARFAENSQDEDQ